MYDELVKRLRNCTSDTVEDCTGCPYQGGYKGTYCMNGLIDEAADAIEELSKLADAIPHVCECCIGCEMEKKNGGCDNAFVLSPKRAMQYLIKPRWIPVKERLPEILHTVIVSGRMKYEWETDYYRFVDVAAYTEGEFFETFNDWYEGQDEFEITHWMPLPPAPKEEE